MNSSTPSATTSAAPLANTAAALFATLPATPGAGSEASEVKLTALGIVLVLILAACRVVDGNVASLVITAAIGWIAQKRTELKKYHLDTLADALANLPQLQTIAAPLRAAAGALAEEQPPGDPATPVPPATTFGNGAVTPLGTTISGETDALTVGWFAFACWLLLALAIFAFSGCAGSAGTPPPPKLPAGSTLDAGASWSKDEGPKADAHVHIPLSQRRGDWEKRRLGESTSSPSPQVSKSPSLPFRISCPPLREMSEVAEPTFTWLTTHA